MDEGNEVEVCDGTVIGTEFEGIVGCAGDRGSANKTGGAGEA